MATYKLNHTDPANGKISILDDTTDGHSSPSSPNVYVHPSTGLPATGKHTSLVFVGRSLVDYGDIIQNNMLYMLENFANSTRPQAPTQGQLWYKNTSVVDTAFPRDPTEAGLYIYQGTKWVSVPMTSGGTDDLNMSGYRILNLGDAEQPGDAVSKGFADQRYLQLAGGTVVGPTTFDGGPVQIAPGTVLNIVDLPTEGPNATNKTYVDTADQQLLAMINDLSGNVTTDLSRYVRKVGDTMTGTLAMDPNAGLTFLSGTGAVVMGSRRIQNLGEPANNTDATTRFYVDNAISTAVASIPPPSIPDDIYVNGGNIDPATGSITLLRAGGAVPVVVTGNVALKDHTHNGNSITITTKTDYPLSTIANMVAESQLNEPEDTIGNVVRVLDQAITDVSRPKLRRVFKQTDATTVLYTVPQHMTYQVDQCAVEVYVNGVKHIANERGLGVMFFNNPVLLRVPFCENGTFVLNINVNGVVYPLTITATDFSMLTFAQAVVVALEAAGAPATVQLDQTMSGIYLYVKTLTTGAGSSVDLSGAIAVLTAKIPSFDYAQSYSVTQTYGYFEVGDPGDDSTQIQFNEPLPIGSVIEVITS